MSKPSGRVVPFFVISRGIDVKHKPNAGSTGKREGYMKALETVVSGGNLSIGVPTGFVNANGEPGLTPQEASTLDHVLGVANKIQSPTVVDLKELISRGRLSNKSGGKEIVVAINILGKTEAAT
jgi:hypothetical protein